MSDSETLRTLATSMALAMVFAGIAAAVSEGRTREMWAAFVFYPLYLLPFWLVVWLFVT